MKWIVNSKTDIPFFILAALSGYALLSAHFFLGISSVLLWWFWNVSMNGPHFFATISRTYLDREEWRQRPGLLVGSLGLIAIGPLAIWLSLQLQSGLPFLLFTLQLTVWAYYHVVRQHYGFLALYQKANGETVSAENRADFWIFHTVMFAPALIWFVRDPQLQKNLGLGENLQGPQALIVGALTAAIVLALAACVMRGIASFRAGQLNLPKYLLLAAYVPLHLLVFLYPPIANRYDPYLTNSVLTYPHNIQYMAIVWFYGRNRYHGAQKSVDHGLASTASRSLLVFCLLAFAYGAIYYYTNWFLEGVSVPGSLGAFSLARTPLAHEGGPAVADLVASIWIGFAFHHYYLDQKIWRVSKDRRLAKDLQLPST